MVLHELATNAAKYGALLNGSGRIAVDWAPIESKRMRLFWRESGGMASSPTGRKGFGTLLIEEAFSSQGGGRAKLEYGPAGLVCTLECPHL